MLEKKNCLLFHSHSEDFKIYLFSFQCATLSNGSVYYGQSEQKQFIIFLVILREKDTFNWPRENKT